MERKIGSSPLSSSLIFLLAAAMILRQNLNKLDDRKTFGQKPF